MCLLKLMLCSKASSVHPSPATLSVVPCGPQMDPNLSIQQLHLSHLSLHTAFQAMLSVGNILPHPSFKTYSGKLSVPMAIGITGPAPHRKF